LLQKALFGSRFSHRGFKPAFRRQTRTIGYYYVHRIGPVTGPPGAALQAIGVPFLLVCGFWLFMLWHHKPLRGFNTRTPISIILSNEGIAHQSGDAQIQTPWSAIRKVEATQGHLFLWAPANRIFIVPRRAFDSDEGFVQFRDFARRYQEAAGRSEPESPPIARV
jgi:hypothetical protein